MTKRDELNELAERKCSVSGCGKPCHAKGFCSMHHSRFDRHGTVELERPPEMGFSNASHPLYERWRTMRSRCSNPKKNGFKDYGGRGIEVCKEWDTSFQVFLTDMGMPPTSEHTIDRIDNDGNYNSLNCRWATPKEQQSNRRCEQPLGKLGCRGVRLNRYGKYEVRKWLSDLKKSIHLGTVTTIQEAEELYNAG